MLTEIMRSVSFMPSKVLEIKNRGQELDAVKSAPISDARSDSQAPITESPQLGIFILVEVQAPDGSVTTCCHLSVIDASAGEAWVLPTDALLKEAFS